MMVQLKSERQSVSQIPGGIILLVPPNAKDQPDHGIKYLRVGAVANTLCHGLGCIQLLGGFSVIVNI
jgi:hypothetical protein